MTEEKLVNGLISLFALPINEELLDSARNHAAVGSQISTVLFQPLDIVKIRHQLCGKTSSIFETLSALRKERGFIRFYRGLGPEFLVTKQAQMHGVYEAYHDLIAAGEPYEVTSYMAMQAGYLSAVRSIPYFVIVNPLEVIKVRLQAAEHLELYNHAFDCVYSMVKQEGVLSLFKGLGTTLVSHCVYFPTYFAVVHAAKRMLPFPSTPALDMQSAFLSGFCGGAVAAFVNAPIDLVKSKLQAQIIKKGTPAKYRNMLQTLFVVVREGGIRSLYRGVLPYSFRMGLIGAFTMTYLDYGLLCGGQRRVVY